MLLNILLLLVSLTSLSYGQDICHVNGQCSGIIIGGGFTDTYNQCLTQCQADELCNFITHIGRTKECIHYSDCLQIDTQCVNCFSGQSTCPQYEPMCDQAGLCTGTFISEQVAQSSDDCLRLCQLVPECFWYTYFSDSNNCVLTEDCLLFDGSCTTCLAGERQCGVEANLFTKLMIVTGFPENYTSDVEVINLSPSFPNCQKPPDSPGGRAMVGAFLENKPMICGGETGGNACYFYSKDDNSWMDAPPTIDGRFASAGVLMNDSAWWVTGGLDDAFLSSTEIYTANVGWSSFTDLPVVQEAHCILRVDETRYFLIGGVNQGERAYLYEMASNEWTQLEDATMGHSQITCGVVTRENREKEVVIAGGSRTSASEIFSFTTMSWRQGPDLPGNRQMAIGVPYGDTFLAVGGYAPLELYDTILKYDQVNDAWEILPQTLAVARGVESAFLVSDDSVICT